MKTDAPHQEPPKTPRFTRVKLGRIHDTEIGRDLATYTVRAMLNKFYDANTDWREAAVDIVTRIEAWEASWRDLLDVPLNHSMDLTQIKALIKAGEPHG